VFSGFPCGEYTLLSISLATARLDFIVRRASTSTESPSASLERFVNPGDRVLLGTAAGAALTLQAALNDQAERLTDLHLVGGLQLGDYTFMDGVRAGTWRYDTWHVMASIREDVASGLVGLHLVRGAAVPGLIRRLAPDVFLTSVSEPDAGGEVSFGASVSYALEALDHVPRVIAEINPGMPPTEGRTRVPVERFAGLVEAEQPLPTHTAGRRPPEAEGIAAHVRELIPDGATVQIGLGAVPEALVESWTAAPPPGLRVFGMGIDGMVPLLEKLGRPGSFVGGELLGTETLYDFARDNPLVEQYPIAEILAVRAVSAIPRFVSLTGALEVDLSGQINAEWAAGRQISGPGGGFDFIDAAGMSDGGLAITALPSTFRRGERSTIVPRLAEDAPITVPRHSAQVVVTEHGVADLRGLTVAERAEAMIAIADPAMRDGLADSLPGAARGRPTDAVRG
jgi:acyl-CoA hydrolase